MLTTEQVDEILSVVDEGMDKDFESTIEFVEVGLEELEGVPDEELFDAIQKLPSLLREPQKPKHYDSDLITGSIPATKTVEDELKEEILERLRTLSYKELDDATRHFN